MTHTYSKLLFHFVWSTKNRQPLIDPKIKNQVYNYIRAIVENRKCKLININGMPDHIHLLVSTPVTINITDFIKTIKTSSTRLVRREFLNLKTFAWQEGYGAFTVSYSNEKKVLTYIVNQEIHHGKMSFEEEYVRLLKKMNIPFDERFIFG
jgi:putative transposase